MYKYCVTQLRAVLERMNVENCRVFKLISLSQLIDIVVRTAPPTRTWGEPIQRSQQFFHCGLHVPHLRWRQCVKLTDSSIFNHMRCGRRSRHNADASLHEPPLNHLRHRHRRIPSCCAFRTTLALAAQFCANLLERLARARPALEACCVRSRRRRGTRSTSTRRCALRRSSSFME